MPAIKEDNPMYDEDLQEDFHEDRPFYDEHKEADDRERYRGWKIDNTRPY